MQLLFRRASEEATSIGLIIRSGSTSSEAIWSCTVVDRSGPAATGFWLADNTLRAAGEASGLIVDLLLRSLGQPTLPCLRSTQVFWSADWLARIALAAEMGDRPLFLAQVRTMCAPGFGSGDAGLDDVRSLDEQAQRWADELTGLGYLYSWDELHAGLADGEITAPLMPPRAAAWFDGGSLGRWCFSSGLFGRGVESLSSLLLFPADDTVRAALSMAGDGENGPPTPLGSNELLP